MSSGAKTDTAKPSSSPLVAALENKITQLETDASLLKDMSEVKRLQRAYGYYVDKAMWDEVANLFADDGSIELALDGVYVGKERVREYLHTLGGGRVGLKEGQLNEHMQLQPVVHVSADGQTAKGRWRTFYMVGQYHERALWGEGPYENEYIKDNGVWKIKKLHWYQTFMVPYAGGWIKNKDATGGKFVSAKLPADKLPTESYEVWPGVYTPPFHFDSPMTARAPEAPSIPAADAADPAVSALIATVTSLERRIQSLRDTNDIENLISAYGYYLDKQRWDSLAELFAEDATMEISQRGVYVGRTNIRKAFHLFGPQGIEPNHLHNHIQLQPVIHVAPDGQTAKARSRAFSQLGTFERVGIWMGGVYENEFVKVNGVWKYKKDHVFTTYFATYDEALFNGARATAKVSDKIPPDRPPTIVYESYPEIYTPEYHYKNPVTGAEPAVEASTAASSGPVPQELTGVATRSQRVAEQVLRLEDERAIEILQRSYGFYVDKAQWKEAADLFAEDGTLEIGGRGVFVGKARILEYLNWLSPGGLRRGLVFDHMQLQPIVTVAPDGLTAKCRSRFFAHGAELKKYAIWGLGTYENEYVKQNGVWKIKTLHAYFRMYTPQLDGWAKTAIPNTKPEKDLPPDRPPTVVHEQYPATYIPPYHYKHPVTGN